MVSNLIKKSLLLSFLFLSACNYHPQGPDTTNENILGNKLENVSPMKAADGSEKKIITIFDETIRKVHEFDLTTMTCPRSFAVLNPNEKHYVLNDQNGNYIIDFSSKHLSVFDRNSNAQHQPIEFVGKPVSAAFRPELGLLIMYDDLKNVGVLKLLPDGHVAQAQTFGSIVEGEDAIAAGDLLEDGRLVLSLSDNSLVIIDIQQSLAQGHFVFTKQATSLTKISWLAPVPNKPNLVFMKADNQAVLYNLSTASVVATLPVDMVIKLSKSSAPHMIDRKDANTARLVYTDGVSIKAITLYNQTAAILSSELDLAGQTWTSVELSSYTGFSLFNDANQVREQRLLKRFRLPDMLALQSKTLPNEAQIKLGSDYFFALYPSELGYAEKTSILEDSTLVLKQFNLKKF